MHHDREPRAAAAAVERLVAGWAERTAREHEAAAARTAELRARARRAAGALARLGARRVVLFGSLARGRARAGSDIDLAVEGLPAAALLDALVRAEQAAGPGVTVDLVRVEEARGALRGAIDRGEVLVGR